MTNLCFVKLSVVCCPHFAHAWVPGNLLTMLPGCTLFFFVVCCVAVVRLGHVDDALNQHCVSSGTAPDD